jgi:PHP family Zn ribbon phosphoesterase
MFILEAKCMKCDTVFMVVEGIWLNLFCEKCGAPIIFIRIRR